MKKRSSTDYIVIHCSATPPSMDIGVEEIRRWHTEERGWADIGYHYVIRRDGSIEIGRRSSEEIPYEWDSAQGAHVSGWNHRSVGICVVGGVDAEGNPEANFTDNQWIALGVLVQALEMKYPNAEVLGHRDFPGVAKACPSFDVREWHRSRQFELDLYGVPVDDD